MFYLYCNADIDSRIYVRPLIMDENLDFLGKTLRNIVSFPVTLFGILFIPSRVLNEKFRERRCPPGIALTLSIIVWFIGNRTLLQIMAHDQSIPSFPGSDEIINFIVIIAFAILGQAFVIMLLTRKKSSYLDWFEEAQYLAYPFAISLFLYGIAVLLSVHFPEKTKFVARLIANVECLDKHHVDYSNGYENCVQDKTATLYLQSKLVALTIAIFAYIGSVINVLRVRVKAGLGRKISIILINLVIPLIIMLFILSAIEKTEEQVEKLSGEDSLKIEKKIEGTD